jgi:hypothetical protein
MKSLAKRGGRGCPIERAAGGVDGKLYLAVADGECRLPDARRRAGRERHAHGSQIGERMFDSAGDLIGAAAEIGASLGSGGRLLRQSRIR